uniref:Uncharacterized protein n=1 Tax=Borely moumouvirus TaxID=2712067 RepID=A0A6G6AC66_9VIRU
MSKKIDYKNKPFWNYESSMGDDTNVSVRCYNTVCYSDYYNYLGNFISSQSYRIKHITSPSKTITGEIICLIKLSGREQVIFKNGRA